MNLNLIWWRRWRRHDHTRVHAYTRQRPCHTSDWFCAQCRAAAQIASAPPFKKPTKKRKSAAKKAADLQRLGPAPRVRFNDSVTVIQWKAAPRAAPRKRGEPVLEDYFQRAVARDDSEAARHTDFGAEAAWRPQLVVIVVGGNDLYGGKTPPSEEEFVQRYVQLLRTVREKRPAPTVLLSVVYSLDTPGYNSSASAGRREVSSSIVVMTSADEEKQKMIGDAGLRSPYLSHAKRALCQLSYVPYAPIKG